MAQDPRCRLRPVSLKLSQDENGDIDGDLLETRIIELKALAERSPADPMLDLGALSERLDSVLNTNLAAIFDAITVMQSMLISSVAGVDQDLEVAMHQLAMASQKLQVKALDDTDLDGPGLKIFQRRVFEENEMSKSPIADEKEQDDELERD